MPGTLYSLRQILAPAARSLVAATSLIAVLAAPFQAMADDQAGLVYPPRAVIAGRTYNEWTAVWWQYILAIPDPVNPTKDASGNFCDLAQRGPVWFLAGSPLGKAVTRKCQIPAAGLPILVPIINAECSTRDEPPVTYPNGFRCSVENHDCDDCAKYWREQMDPNSLKVSVDGESVQALSSFHFRSPLFRFFIPANNVLPAPGPATGFSVSDGFWVMLKPLRAGRHTIHFEGAIPSALLVNVTYELTVVPPKRYDGRGSDDGRDDNNDKAQKND